MTRATRGIYKFHWDCGRNGELDGVFAAESADIAEIIGKNVYFGEVLGKHSEVYGTIEANEIKLISENPSDVEVFDRLGLHSGFNPLHYVRGEDEEDE